MNVNIGVIGAGWWATYAHLPAIKNHPHATLRAVQKRSLDQARQVAADFGAEVAYAEVEDLLADQALAAVIIASTPNVHFQQARAGLERGLHVLVEKPMTLTAREARSLVALAQQRKLQLLISCPWHFTRHGIEARKMIHEGYLGRVKMISVLMTNPVAHLLRGTSTAATYDRSNAYLSPREGSYSDPAVAGGGQAYCQVSHAAAYISYLTGTRPREVFARFDNDGARVDLYDTIDLKMEDGCLVSIASTGVTPDDRRNFEVRVFGTEGVLLLELWQGTMEFHAMDGRRIEVAPLTAEEIFPARAPAVNLVDAVLSNAANRSPGWLGLAATEVIEGACRSAETGMNYDIAVARAGGEMA